MFMLSLVLFLRKENKRYEKIQRNRKRILRMLLAV